MENNNFEQQPQQFTDNNVNPQQPMYQQPPFQGPPPVDDKKNVLLNIISFLFPLIGLILYLVLKNQTPIKAKGCGKAALIGFIVGVIVSIVFQVAGTMLLGGLM